MDAHRPCARMGRGRALVGACIRRGHVWVVGAYRAWARMGRGRISCMGAYGLGRVWVVGVYGSWVGPLLAVGGRYVWVRGCLVHGHSSFVVVGRCHPSVGRCRPCGMVFHRWWGGGRRGPWALSVGAGYRLWALGAARARWVPLWVLGIVRGRWVVVSVWKLG